jgi:hypothetical protein
VTRSELESQLATELEALYVASDEVGRMQMEFHKAHETLVLQRHKVQRLREQLVLADPEVK